MGASSRTAVSDVVVRARGVCRYYERGSETVRAIDSVDLEVEAGELVALTGPSGSGKSTLLYLLGCLDQPTSGELMLFDRHVAEMTERDRVRLRRERLGFVFQRYHLVPILSVAENVRLPDAFARRRTPDAAIADLLERVGLTTLANRRVEDLSAGDRQRAAIARALVGRPQLVLADEPTARLDPGEREAVGRLLGEIASRGVAVVTATHDDGLVSASSRTVRLRSGRVV